MEKLILEDYALADVLGDDAKLEAFVRKAAVGVWHASCTCRMGAADDPMAAGSRHRRLARRRRLDLSGRPPRQHQFFNYDDGGEDCGCDFGWAVGCCRDW